MNIAGLFLFGNKEPSWTKSFFFLISIYYGLSVCIFPPNVEALTPNVIVFGSGAFGRIIRYRWDHECGVLTIELMIFLKIFIYLFIYGCVGSSFLCEGFLQLR